MPSMRSFARLGLYLAGIWAVSLLFVVFGYSDPTTRAGANLANFLLAPHYPENARDQTAIVEVDSSYVEGFDDGRSWPPTYDRWGRILSVIDNELDPSGIVFDIVFLGLREGEGWERFVARLCNFGAEACTDPSGGTAFCTSKDVSANATRVFLPMSVRSQIEAGPAHQDLRRLAEDCGHIYRFGVSYRTGFETVRLYNLDQPDTLAPEAKVPSMAVGVFNAICDEPGWYATPPDHCERTQRRLERLSAVDGKMEIFWGIGQPIYDWPQRQARCGLVDYDLPIEAKAPENLTDKYRQRATNPCPYPDFVELSVLQRPDFDKTELKGRLVFIGRDHRDGGDKFPIAGGPAVRHSGTFQLQMALDNLLALGPHFKADRLSYGPATWVIIFGFSYCVGAILLVSEHNRRAEAPLYQANWTRVEAKFWLKEIIGLAKVLTIYLIIASICFYLFDWGFMLWVSSLSLGSVAGIIGALRSRSLD